MEFLDGFLTKTAPRLVVPIHWDDLFSYKSDNDAFFELKPQSAFTNTIAKTQESIELICNTAAQNPDLYMGVFQFGVSYAANVSTSSISNPTCHTVQQPTQ